MSVGGAAKAKKKDAFVVGSGKGFTRRGSREQHIHINAVVVSPPNPYLKRHSGSLPRPPPLHLTAALGGRIPAISEPRHAVVVAQFITLSPCSSFDFGSAISLLLVTPLGLLLTSIYETV